MSAAGVFPVFKPKELCETCQRLTLANPVEFNFIGELEFLPHHETIDSFYKAIERRCYLCTQMRHLLHRRNAQLIVERENRTWVGNARHKVVSKPSGQRSVREKPFTKFRIGVIKASKSGLWVEFEVNGDYISFIAYRSQGISCEIQCLQEGANAETRLLLSYNLAMEHFLSNDCLSASFLVYQLFIATPQLYAS
jgi:hypothetical protein